MNKAGIVSENSENIDALQKQLQQYAEMQKLLLEITQRIASSDTLDDMLPAIRAAVQRGLHADSAIIVLGTDQADVGYAVGDDRSPSFGAAGPALLGYVAQNGAIEASDVSADAALSALNMQIKGLLTTPLMAHNIRQGIIALGYAQPHTFSSDERIFLALVAAQTAVAVENAHAYEVVHHGQEQLAAILASTADPVIVVDAQEAIVLLNPAAERALGVESKTVSGKKFGEVINVEPLLELLRNPANRESLEWQNESGQTYAPRVSDINTGESRRRGHVLVLRDITRYKNILANQTEFVGTVSHDLRSPLTYMQGYATMLPMVGELNARQKDFTDKIVGGIAQMTDLVDKILDAGRLDPETGYYELIREPCDVVKMANEVITNHLQPAEKKGLKLIGDIDPNLPIFNLDEMMLKRALNNFVDNAVKYTPEGGTVTVSAHTEGGSLLLKVADTGLGISEDNIRHLFERFRRVRRKEHQKVKGSGFGLFIVKSVAQKHNGDAWVESKEGVGSTFIIRIPMEGANMIGAESKADPKLAKKAE